MNTEVQKIKDFLFKYFKEYRRTMKELSYDSANDEYLVDSPVKGFMFDKMKEYLLKSEVCSVDALYPGHDEYINFIEFKNGKNINNFKKNCMRSGKDSKFLYRIIMSYSDYKEIDFSQVKYRFITVIDATSNGRPSTAYGVAMARHAQKGKEKELLSYLIPGVTDITIMGQTEFYDDVQIWTSYDFGYKIKRL